METLNRPLHVNNREAVEVYNYLKYKLGLPDNLNEFSVKFTREGLVEVSCVYHPKASDISSSTITTW